MGQYERTHKAIASYQEAIERLNAELIGCESEERRGEIYEAIAEYEIGIGECEGYLQELASMDGYSSYDEMVYDCMQYEEACYGI